MALATALLHFPAFAQTEFRDDFQAYKTPSNPPGWIDTSVGTPKPEAAGLYKAWPDPLQGNQGPNVVYGTKQSSGKPEGNNPRIGTFSTLTTKTFNAKGRFEYQGRLIRTNSDSRIGLTFLSSYPEQDKYYLLGLWSQGTTTQLTMQLFGFGAGTLQGTIDSNVVIDPNRWYRFLVQVDDVDNTTKIRARFWPDGTTEPTTFAIDATDAAATRLTTGRIGIWAAVKGEAYVDDLFAKSPVDHTPPTIVFADADTGTILNPATLALFKKPARIEIRVTDDLSSVTTTAKLDGTTDYVSATPITVDGLHKITVHAVDGPGNAADAALDLLVDQVPPLITLQINGATFAPGAIFNDDITLNAVIQDISETTSVATLNGEIVTLPKPIAEERAHAISVSATDQVGWQSTAASSFIVDKTPPVVTIFANGNELGGGESFQADVTLTWTATDLTLDRVEATLNGAPITSGTVVNAERIHDLVVKAYDKATHSTTETRRFVLDKTAPEVRLLANGETFKPGTTFNTPVTFTVEVHDSTPTTESATLDGQTYTLGTAYGTEGPHTIKVVVTNAANLSTTVGPAPFTIDLTPPTITLTESGQPFTDGMKFNRDVNPIVTANDNLTANPERVLTLDGDSYPLDTPIAEEKAEHVISATATDDGGNSTSVGPFRFMLDKTKPVVTIVEAESNAPFAADALFARPVRVKVTVVDLTRITVAAMLNNTAFDLGAPQPQSDGSVVFVSAPVGTDGQFTVSVVATDEVAWKNDPVTASFTIDMTPPHLTFTSHQENAVIATPTITVTGGSDDAVTVTVNQRPATVDLTAKTFESEPLALVEGANTITAIGTDKAGNTGTALLHLELDTRAPEVAITTPAADACIDATTLTVSGTVSDPRAQSVKVNGVTATLTNNTWTASVPVDEGQQLLTIVAADTLGHVTTVTRNVLIDRTAPAIDVRESGAPLTATLFNRFISLLVRAVDADPGTAVEAKLDGAPYASGTTITAEGAHSLEVAATDCAGHRTARTFAFAIDRTPPQIRNLNPANGSTVGTMPNAISGTTDPDAARVEILGTTIAATPAPDGTFVLNGVAFAEGTNRFVLQATDKAGNSAQLDYVVTVKTTAPIVTILENGSRLVSGSLFNRPVTPEIRVNESSANVSATLNGAPFTSGTTVSNEGDYRLIATAADSFGHTGTAETIFTIDRTAPVVRITFPASGPVSAEQIEVRGTAGNSVSADVNGIPVTLAADGSFVLPTLFLEFGTNRIVATGRDRAGNVGRDEVEVVRDDIRPGILLTYPPDRSLTNRPVTEVLGRVLSPSPDGVVTIGTTTVPIDTLGAFRLSGYALVEGENTITASTKTGNGGTNSASVHVTADFTPPSLTILESDQALEDGARFGERAVLTLLASDNRGSVTTELTIDGTKVLTLPHTVTATGGHSAAATARDQAGNETRAERTFFIGTTGGGSTTCTLNGFDPADNAVVLSASATLIGRSGGAEGVKVNDVAASVGDGSFRATVELPVEGANVFTLRCTDAAGTPFGDPVTLTLNRVTGDPSITITAPTEGFVTADDTITITGTVGPGVISADVNGAPALIAGTDPSATRPYSVANVRLASGLNVLVAHGRNAAGRVATASRRVFALKNNPTISISTPLTGATTGANKIDVAGTYTNLDPSTITVTNVANGASVTPQTVRSSDTTGTYTAIDLPLVAGEQVLRVTGRDEASRQATAVTVTVKLVAGAPSISITSPAPHSYFGPDAGDSFTASGTFGAAPGSTVEVNGVAATLGEGAFTATATFSQLATTPVVARVTEPAGASAVDTILVTKLAAAPRVIESFPAPNAVEVDAGALLLVLFSAPMDRATLAGGGFRLEDTSGASVSGTLYLDKDVLTFAPAALLARGAHYTLRVTTAAKDVAGTALQSEYVAGFTTATSAPSTPPTLTPVTQAFCGQTVTISGTAPAGARLRLESGSLTLTDTADAQGNFHFDFPISGQSGFAIVRVRVVGSDGSLSPAAELSFRVDCVGPQVLNATYDRGGTNRISIQFSEAIDAATATTGSAGALFVTLTDGRSLGGTATVSGNSVTLVPSEDLTAKSFALNVTTAIRDTIGNKLTIPYTQNFTVGGEQPPAGDGSGFISGEIYDATTGRPLAGATIAVEVASGEFTTHTDARGRYLVRLPEGAHTIRASMPGYTTVWRQIIVLAGAGVVPIDIRLTKRGDTKTSTGTAMTLAHGGETAITRPVSLQIPSVTTGKTVSLTAVGAQALTGLLPLGWSPIASAEVAADVPLTGAQLTFTVPASEITSASQTLAAVRYDDDRDEWPVLASVVNIAADGKVTIPIDAAGAYALVYADKAPGLAAPPLATAGAALVGVGAPATPAPLFSRAFTLDPPIVLPNGRAVANLQIEGAGSAVFPSGTAVQAYIDEELRLADGSRLLDPPFATDLLLYRNLAGNTGIADFHLAPSARAAQVILEIGFDHIRVVPYPGRLDRGTLIGPEGGRIPGDDRIAIDLPAGATPEPLHASATSLTQQDLDAVGPIAGFRVLGGFALSMTRTNEAPQDADGDGIPDADMPPVELFKPARATFTLSAQQPAGTQFVLVELLDQTAYGKMVRLAAQMTPIDARVTTKTIDRSILPLDGVVREGRYLLLAADAPIAFATGLLRLGGLLLPNARISATSLGVAELTRTTGLYNIPVPASPAAPFTLTPRHVSTGDGAPYTHTTAPAPDAVVKLDLNLTRQPPTLTGVTVFAGNPPAQVPLTSGTIVPNVSLTTSVRASFSPNIDSASISDDSITVIDAITGIAVGGKATAEGTVAVNWSLTPGTRLESDHRYTIHISPRIRAANGAELSTPKVFSFITLKTITNTEVRAERITITIPDANGVSRVTGEPGALPAGWQGLVVRRRIDFVTRYQATAAADGSFTFLVGNGGNAGDRVTMADLIDLQVVNTAGNLAAIIPLTPFVTEDRRGFVVPTGEAVKVTTPDGISVAIEAGTFDEPTMVNVNVVPKTVFDNIPSLDHDVNFAGSVKLDFEGRANKPIEIELPVPAGMDTTNRTFLLALKEQSIRGPRLFAVDTLRIADGKFTTTLDPASASRRIAVHSPGGATTNETMTGQDHKNYMLRVERSGVYMALDIRQPVGGGVGWAVMGGLQGSYDIFWSTLASFVAPHYYVIERARIVIPVITGLPFTVVGVDATTGAQAFSKAYDPIPIGDPGVSTLPSPQNNMGGPYPIFGTPFRVEAIDLNAPGIDITSVRNFVARLENDQVTIASSEEDQLPEDTPVQMLNVSKGELVAGTAGDTMTLPATLGDRVVLLIEQREVDPSTGVSVVFNEPIYIDGTEPAVIDAFLRERFTLWKATLPPADATEPPDFAEITDTVRFSADSGGRRITFTLPSSLQREAIYRLVISKTVADRGGTFGTEGFTLGQGAKIEGDEVEAIGGEKDLLLEFRVRKPGGTIATFELPDGGARDLALNGNVLLVAAAAGGLIAYDVADPASLNGEPEPMAIAPSFGSEFWAIASDHHGRVYSTNLGPIAGQLRSYRLEDFIKGAPTCCIPIGSSLINWRVGYSSNLGLVSNTMLSDRPESFPRKLSIVVQDEEKSYNGRTAFIAQTGATVVETFGDIQQLKVTIPFDTSNKHLYQRITVENLSLDMRWSADATPVGGAAIENIIAGPHDRMRVLRNRTTYGVVNHLGYGIGVYDINAIESNRSPHKPFPYINLAEQIFLTRGLNDKSCFAGGEMPPSWGIPEIWLSSDAAVRTEPGSTDLMVYAPDPYRGLLDMRLKMPTPENPATQNNRGPMCGHRSPTGLVFRAVDPAHDHPRIKALKTAYQEASGHLPYPHFLSVANYRWRKEAQDNKLGERWSIPNETVTRDYVLVAGGDLGLLVVEVAGNPMPQIEQGVPLEYYPLLLDHLVDIIWVPNGALAVRAIPRTNFAVVVSRYGRVHLVDLSRIDERFTPDGEPIPSEELFPTAAAALAAPNTYSGGVGADDPRIVWTSEPDVALGVLPPVVDADTGMLYAGHITSKIMKAVAAIDPRIQLKVDLGKEGGLSEVGGIVPHGIDPPKDILDGINALPPCGPGVTRCRNNASLGTFRIEVSLPGAIAEALTASGNQLQVAVESERVPGAPSEQTPVGFPRSHLRRYRRDGSEEPQNRAATNFRLQRVVPEDPELEKALRHQRGFNKFISPWIVAIADPRASEKYLWPGGATPEQRAEAGCRSCQRPQFLNNAAEAQGVYELWTNGRVIAVRPEIAPEGGENIFAGSPYEYLGEQNRLVTRFSTIMADTVRPTDVRVAGQNPPVAEGALQETVYLHSGELEVDGFDMNADGRAGFDVVFDRTYRSRTIGGTILGQGWDSANLRRLRALPSGEVELRDARGEIWLFKPKTESVEYEPPKGYFQRLIRTPHGWTLLDQQWRATGFDDLGRLSFETDEFANQAALGAGTSDGNVIRYLYDSSGRLAQIVDPVDRASTLTYWKDSEASETGAYPGLLKQVKDWRNRTTLYEYDDLGRLERVKAPEVTAASGVPTEFSFTGDNRPRTEYEYKPATLPPDASTPSQAFNDYIEYVGNLESIKDPDQMASPTGAKRVTFTYGTSGQSRDRLTEQEWATGETVTFTHTSNTEVSSEDALGQKRKYTLTDRTLYDERAHIALGTVESVAIIEEDTLPNAASVSRQHDSEDLLTLFTYNDEGLHESVTHPNGLIITNKWAYPTTESEEGDRVQSVEPGMVLESSTTTGPGLTELKTDIKYDQEPDHENARATPVAVERGDEERDAQSPSGERLKVETREDGFSVETEYDKRGLIAAVRKKQKNNDDDEGVVVQETWTVHYSPTATPPLARSRPFYIYTKDETTGEVTTKNLLEYEPLSNGGEKVILTDDLLKTVTETHYDANGHTIREIVTANGKTLSEGSFGYDAMGRLKYQSRKQSGVDVITRFKYDAMGRQTEMTTTGAAVNGTPTTLTTVTEHDFANLTITEHDPTAGAEGARTIKKIDTLGRPKFRERINGANYVLTVTGFDSGGAESYVSDGTRIATMRRNDAFGREIVAVTAEGLRTETTWTDWNEPLEVIQRDAGGVVVGHMKNTFTKRGRLQSIANAVEAQRARITRMSWTAGDTQRSMHIGPGASVDAEEPLGVVRFAQMTFDAAGRKTEEIFGSANSAQEEPGPNGIYAATSYTYKGAYPKSVTRKEPRVPNASSTTKLTYDGLGRLIQSDADGAKDSTVTEYDEAGNPLSVKAPGMKPMTAKYDSRGLVTETTHPDGTSTVRYTYDALGNVLTYKDESDATTTIVPDSLGRVSVVQYPDGTSEETRYENGSGLVTAKRDRANQWLSFSYGTGGRVEAVHAGPSTNDPKILQYNYDPAGRLAGIFNADAGITYDGYDLLGRPSITRTYRYADGSGLSGSPTVIDVHTQSHRWSIFDGERESWSMPRGGTAPPVDDPASPWLQIIHETRDAGSNLIQQRRGSDVLTEGNSRAVNKLGSRSRAAGSSMLNTFYGYEDGTVPPVPSPQSNGSKSFALRYAVSTYAGTNVGGSSNGRDVAERIAATRDLGIDLRTSKYTYDDRGRLNISQLNISNAESARPPTVDEITPGDFRIKRTIPAVLSPAEHEALGAAAAEIEPTSWTATQNTSHQILNRQSFLDGIPIPPRTYTFQGGRRTQDGDWTSSFDAFGRLKSISSNTATRRIDYAWSPNNRLVGRTAYQAVATGWILEDRANVLREDGLPAKTTFVWDAVEDRLLAIYEEGSSTAAEPPAEQGLLRQFLHGDQGYDDPIRVIAADPDGTVRSYLPIFDEAGTGSLQAVVDAATGNVVERVLYADAYGHQPRYLQGAVIDKIEIQAKKDSENKVEKVILSVHLTEAIDPLTVSGGVHLGAVTATGTFVASQAVPVLQEPSTIKWELGQFAWQALVTSGVTLEIAVTSSLHTRRWGDTPVSFAPEWAATLFGVTSEFDVPFIKRESFESLNEILALIDPGETAHSTLYEVKDLYLAASRESRTKLFTGFKAAPFIEPATSLVYFRARWYDPATGSWLTPDPRGYAAGSSNLYAGFGNDPVNHIDPTGEEPITATAVLIYLGWTALNTAVDVGIDYGIHLWRGQGEFELGRSITTNFAVNLATGGIGGKVAKLRHLKHFGPFGRKIISEGAEFLADVAVTGTIDVAYGDSVLDAYGGAILGHFMGRGAGAALKKAASMAKKHLPAPSLPWKKRGKGCRCFTPETEVMTPDGPREIAQMRVGDRVVTTSNDARDTDVDPSTWKLLKLRMPILDGTGDVLLIEILRPAEWIEQVRAAAGYWIDLRLPEMSLAGTAEILSIEDAPAIQPGPGRVVLATFEHEDVVLEIRFAGHAEPLRPTPGHRLYSADRNAFVHADAIQPGERLRTRDGDVTVESIQLSAERRRVFDIEVEYDRVYFAGDAEVLSHNNTVPCPVPQTGTEYVYQLVDQNNKVVYYGIADGRENLFGRLSSHGIEKQGKFKGMQVIGRNLTHDQARTLEGALIRKRIAEFSAANPGKIKPDDFIEDQIHTAGLLNDNRGRLMDRWLKDANDNPYVPWHLLENPGALLLPGGNHRGIIP